jgi:HTH-type transcriptional regulator / antitoxin HigA
MSDKPRKGVKLTPEQCSQHQAIRDAFSDWHPGPEELIASGAAAPLGLNVIRVPARADEDGLSMASKQATTSRAVYGKTEEQYLDLVRQFPLRPLRTAADLDAAVAVIDALIDCPRLTAPKQDYLDVLSDLVEAYEAEAVPMRPVGDAELLRFLIEQKGVTQAAVAAGAGIAESTVSAVLAGKRKLKRAQIAGLANYFHVEPGTFLSEA